MHPPVQTRIRISTEGLTILLGAPLFLLLPLLPLLPLVEAVQRVIETNPTRLVEDH